MPKIQKSINYKYKSGEVVKTKNHNYIGKISKTYPECPQNNDWIRAQSIRVRAEDIKSPWYSLLVFGGGSVIVAESDIKSLVSAEQMFDLFSKHKKDNEDDSDDSDSDSD